MKITPAAKIEFANYINSHRKAKHHETTCSKIKDIILHIDEYFAIELQEHDHADVLKMVCKNNNVMSLKIMQQWIIENYYENYIENKKSCR